MPTIISHAITAIPIYLGVINKTDSKKIFWLSLVFAILPDLDGIGYLFGLNYNSFLGHRGFSHSLSFIIIAALVFAKLTNPKIRLKSKNFALYFLNFFIIGALHLMLDALTNGGLGIALFSPFNNQRFFVPWQPIQVSAILPQYFFRLNGLSVIKSELLLLIIPSILLSIIIKSIKKYYAKNH